MIHRNDLIGYLNRLLACEAYTDYAPNGLQVEGIDSIQKIATAVTASLDVIDKAIALKVDALIVHHGYFWKGETAVITGMKKRRLRKLLAQDMNLFAYHLPLDCHKKLGNNARLGQLLQLELIVSHSVSNTSDLLWSGHFPSELAATDLKQQLTHLLGREPLHIASDKPKIQQIAWCTGAAQDFIENAASLGVDAFLSGEISERTYYQAKELGIHYFSCGHHATERYGIQALGEHLVEQFSLIHYFIDSDNPV